MNIRLTFVIFLAGCHSPAPQAATRPAEVMSTRNAPERLVTELNNEDVDWDGNFLGLSPAIQGVAAQELLNLGKAANDVLIRALADPDRFAAAHVLLTHINHKGFNLSASEWNGLRVILRADGRTILYPEQRTELQEYWRRELQSSSTTGGKAWPAL